MADEKLTTERVEGTLSGDQAGAEAAQVTSEAGRDKSTTEAGHQEDEINSYKKQVSDMEKHRDQANRERDEAKAEADKLKTETLVKLVAAASSKEPIQRTQAEVDAELKRIKEDIDERGGDAIIDYMTALVRDVESDATSKSSKEMEEIKASMDVLKKQVQNQSPDYITHKEAVDKLMDMGVPERGLAIQIASVYEPQAKQPENQPLPGSSSSPMVSGDQQKVVISGEALALVEGALGPLTDEEKATYERKSA